MSKSVYHTKKGPQVTLEVVTPAQALKWLDAQREDDHRPIKESVVQRYASDMRNGNWKLNGETVVFYGDRILDGRHRLSAVADSGVPIQMFVVRGIAEDTFVTLDSGVGRSPGDVLHIAGYKNANAVASAARMCLLYDEGRAFSGAEATKVSRTDLMRYLQDHPEVESSAVWLTGDIRRRRMVPRPAVLVAFRALCSNRPEERDIFLEDVILGVKLAAQSPAHLLRERLFREKLSRAKVAAHFLLAFFIKAWNAEIMGEGLKLLRWSPTEQFPEMVTRPRKAQADDDMEVDLD